MDEIEVKSDAKGDEQKSAAICIPAANIPKIVRSVTLIQSEWSSGTEFILKKQPNPGRKFPPSKIMKQV